MSPFSNPPWWKSASIYQVYPASFLDTNNDGIGDLPGIISKVPYLHSLRVDAVWLSPIYKSPQADMGYDISDYFSIHEPYGTIQDVEKLIAALHQRGMKLVMDLVVNHTSNQHHWFLESKASKKNPKRDWYIWRKGREYSVIDGSNGTTTVVKEPPNNWRGVFGGSAWTLDEATGEYYLHLFSPEQPDLNWENPTVRETAYSVMKWWLDKGVDGFRMDVINLISKHPGLPDAPVTAPGEKYQWGTKYYVNGPRLHEFLKEMRREVLSKYDGIAIGEMPWVEDEEEVVKSVQRGRGELDMIFQFDIVDIDIPASSPTKFARLDWPLARLKAIISKWQGIMEDRDGWNTLFLENHDQPRSISRYIKYTNPKHRSTAAKVLATLLALQKGTLFIYQGQEIGMGNVPTSWGIEEFKDIETLKYYAEVKENTKNDPFKMAEAMENIHFRGRDNARTPMQWDTTPHAGFTSAATTPWLRVNDEYKAINASTQVDNPSSIYRYWNQLLELRKIYPDIFVHGVFNMLAPNHDSVLVYQRVAKGGRKAVVVLNFTEREVSINLVTEGVVNERTKHLTVLLDNQTPGEGSKYVATRDLHDGNLRLREFESLVLILDS